MIDTHGHIKQINKLVKLRDTSLRNNTNIVDIRYLDPQEILVYNKI